MSYSDGNGKQKKAVARWKRTSRSETIHRCGLDTMELNGASALLLWNGMECDVMARLVESEAECFEVQKFTLNQEHVTGP
jgi:hypothetical protein